MANTGAALHERGHQVTVAARKGGILLDEAAKKGLEVLPFSLSPFNRLLKAFLLARFLKKEEVDQVVCYSRELSAAGLDARWA